MIKNKLSKADRLVAIWLIIGIVMTVVQILLGGITRLTGSGLSITEWKPILGSIPPLTEAAWQEAFNEYQKIAQYKYMNSHFTISDFKFIYFWEWFHRQWARLIGIVFIIPFLYFITKKYFKPNMVLPLVILFLLGILQATIGWIMVKSGLNEEDLYVSHIRLAIHFVAAFMLLCYEVWFLLKVLYPTTEQKQAKTNLRLLYLIVVLLVVQFTYGAFMAGLKAAAAAHTWPSINGAFFPETLFYANWINHPINVHFVHRNLAYLLYILVVFSFILLRKKIDIAPLKTFSIYSVILVNVQLLLGIFTVISAPKIVPGNFATYEILALSHQTIAIFLLMCVVAQVYFLSKKNI